MKTALLISTYNWPEALNLCLQSALRQSVLPNEILIADDGSTEETKQLIESFAQESSIPIKHFWQEDNGFEKAKILNKAIAGTDADYIIEADGDCIFHKDFVKDHLRRVRPNWYLFGMRVNIKKDFVQGILKNNKLDFPICSKEFEKAKLEKKLHLPFLNIIHKQKIRYIHTIGCNTSFWRQDILDINGFNEDYTGWGVEDTDLALRLTQKGVLSYKLKYSAIMYHIWHEETVKDRFGHNQKMLKMVENSKKYFCENGINKYLQD